MGREGERGNVRRGERRERDCKERRGGETEERGKGEAMRKWYEEREEIGKEGKGEESE